MNQIHILKPKHNHHQSYSTSSICLDDLNITTLSLIIVAFSFNKSSKDPPFSLDSIGTSFGQSFIKTMTSLSMFLTPNLHLCKDVKTPFMFKILFVSICDFDIPSTWHVTLGN